MPTMLDLSGHKGAMDMIRDMPENSQRGVEKAFWRIGKDLQREVNRQVLRTPKTGNLYRVPGRRRRVRASAPGESHANVTGTLRKSVGFKVGSNEMIWGYGGGRIPAPKYAAAIELGRRDGTIKPRPTLRNSINQELRNTIEHLGDYVVGEIDES